MDTFTLVVMGGVAILAFAGGWVLGVKALTSEARPVVQDLTRTRAVDRGNYLQALRRELANILIWRDPRRYLDLYRRLHADISSLSSWQLEKLEARLGELSKKYPTYMDFDVIGTRDYVLLPDGASGQSDEELEERYSDIMLFGAISSLVNKSWEDVDRFVSTTSDNELKHLTRYVERIEDTKLRLRLQRAMEDYALMRGDELEFENDWYSFKIIPDHAEMKRGIHLKRTNEFGIHSVFYGDERSFESYYRSDPTFTVEEWLNPLTSVIDEIKLER